MEKLVIGACSNIDTLKVGNKISRPFLNGASIYSGYTAELIAPTRIITCIGDEPKNLEIIENAKRYRDNKNPEFDIIIIKDGKSFKQSFELIGTEISVVDKDYGNYNDWNPDVPKFETNTLLLGTGNPVFQKAILDSCEKANHILLDSKLIHLQRRMDKVNDLLKKVDTFFGTKEEVMQLLENCNLPPVMITSLFNIYPNLKTIVEKNNRKGGRVFLSDGTLYTYEPEYSFQEVCSDGAGDVFAGAYSAEIANGENIKQAIKTAAQYAAESVRHFGMKKIQTINQRKVPIRIEERRWKVRDEQDTNRSR